MQVIHLEKQDAEPIDEATHAALDEAEAEFERGEFATLAEARKIVKKRYEAWQKTQKETLPASYSRRIGNSRPVSNLYVHRRAMG